MVFLSEERMELQVYNLVCRHNLTLTYNMGWVPSGHNFSPLCVRLKMSKIVPLKIFDLITCSVLFLKSRTYILKVDNYFNYNPIKVG